MSHDPLNQRPHFGRYSLAVLACALWACVWVPLLVGVGYVIFDQLGDWIERQVWVLSTLLKVVFGLILLGVFAVGTGGTSAVWKRVLYGPSAAPPGVGAKFGIRSRWRPGFRGTDPEAGRCPRCQFNYDWDGTRCGHCGYGPD